MNTVQDSQENEVNGELNDLAVENEVVIIGDNPEEQRVDPSPSRDAKQLRIDNQNLTERLNGAYSRIAELEADLIKTRSYLASKGQVADFRAFKPTFGKDQWRAVWESKYKHMYYNNVPADPMSDWVASLHKSMIDAVEFHLDSYELSAVEDLNDLLSIYINEHLDIPLKEASSKIDSVISVVTLLTKLSVDYHTIMYHRKRITQNAR